MTFRVREDCRLCNGKDLTCVLGLPSTPLANEFPTAPGPQEKFPLYLASCVACGHVQLPVVVDPARLFRDYVYVSGTSPVFVEHFRRYAAALLPGLDRGDLVVEVGSNDGTLLRFFKEAGHPVLGIDPARDLARKATDEGIETWPEFLSNNVADRIVGQRGAVKLVVANNVFAHADDLYGFARAVQRMLAPRGRFVFEVGYLVDVLERTLVDNVYHEHLSYHHVSPLVPFFGRLGMSLVDAERVDTHGGSIRVHVENTPFLPLSTSAANLVVEELRYGVGLAPGSGAAFSAFNGRIDERRRQLREVLLNLRARGKRVAAYGAPAKATTLLHAFELNRDVLDFVVDDNPLKQGRYLPGGEIPVLPSAAIGDRRPDVLLVLAWNFASSIVEKLASFRAAGGQVVVPLPEVRVF